MKKFVFWPVLLIFLGLVFLAHNLGFLPFGALRDFFHTWWPLILIAVGVAGLMRRM
jgi:Domain of unknown function (DUF5668)